VDGEAMAKLNQEAENLGVPGRAQVEMDGVEKRLLGKKRYPKKLGKFESGRLFFCWARTVKNTQTVKKKQ
jgi:hypothetical protein